MVFVKNSDKGVFSPHFAAKSIIRAPLIPLIRRLRRHLPPKWGRLMLLSKSFYSHTRFRFFYSLKENACRILFSLSRNSIIFTTIHFKAQKKFLYSLKPYSAGKIAHR